MSDFKARIGREVPAAGKTRIVFSIRTARGTRMELEGTFTEGVVLDAWTKLHADMANQKPAKEGA
jgi:hypothetical protein